MSLPYFRLYPTDYEAKTAHLSLLEDGAYNRLLRLCWSMPNCELPDDDAWIMRRLRVRTDEERDAVLTVLSEYFTRANRAVSNKRLSEEFEHATSRHDAARINGMKGGRKPKSLETNETEESNGLAAGKRKAKLNQANQNQNQNHINTAHGADRFDEFWQAYPRKVAKPTAARAWAKAIKEADPQAIIDGLQRQAPSMAAKDPQYIPHPATWLSGGRWADQPPEAHVSTDPKHGDVRKTLQGWKQYCDGLGWCSLHPGQVKDMGLE
jgi:uncharacterized protein YdaU (DUF1376 family)